MKELTDLGFKEREIEKVNTFIFMVSPVLKSHLGNSFEIYDLCSGNGLTSFMFLLLSLAGKSVMYDTRQTNKFIKLQKLFRTHRFDYQFHQQDINLPIYLSQNKNKKAIISIHPCAGLADRVIQISLDSKLPFALMTCCHKQIESVSYTLRNPPDSRLMLYEETSDYIDLVRQRYIEERGWFCYRFEIDKRISPRNHILVGVPKS